MKGMLFTILGLLTCSYLIFRTQAGESQPLGKTVPTGVEVAAITHWDLPEPVAPTPKQESAPPDSTPPTTGESEIGSTPQEVAQNYLDHHREEWHLKSYHDFRPTVTQTPVGTTVRFDVFQNDVPILHSSIEINVNPDLTVATVKNDYKAIDEVDLSRAEGISREEVLEKYQNLYEADPPSQEATPVIVVPMTQTAASKADIAYPIAVHSREKPDQHLILFVRAQDDAIVGQDAARIPSSTQ